MAKSTFLLDGNPITEEEFDKVFWKENAKVSCQICGEFYNYDYIETARYDHDSNEKFRFNGYVCRYCCDKLSDKQLKQKLGI